MARRAYRRTIRSTWGSKSRGNVLFERFVRFYSRLGETVKAELCSVTKVNDVEAYRDYCTVALSTAPTHTPLPLDQPLHCELLPAIEAVLKVQSFLADD